MSQWKSNANTSGAPTWSASILQQGSGHTAKASNTSALVVNTTPGAWKVHGKTLNEVDGIFPVTPGAKANTSGESAKVHGLGWALRTASEGQISSLLVANGSLFANGETITVSGGSTNATATLTTNATGNLASASITTNGLFPNSSSLTANFNREFHVANLNFSNSTALVGVGNANTINVLISNTGIAYGVNAVGSFTSNATGGFTNAATQAITWSGANIGLFSNTQTNTAIVVTFTNANGTVITGTYTATANLVTSTGGAIKSTSTTGGRSGRVTYEMLVIDRHINATATSSVANNTWLPQ